MENNFRLPTFGGTEVLGEDHVFKLRGKLSTHTTCWERTKRYSFWRCNGNCTCSTCIRFCLKEILYKIRLLLVVKNGFDFCWKHQPHSLQRTKITKIYVKECSKRSLLGKSVWEFDITQFFCNYIFLFTKLDWPRDSEGTFRRQVELPLLYLFTKHGGGFTLSLSMLNVK